MPSSLITGKAFVYGANVDTDQIYPGRYLELTDQQDLAEHAMEGADPAFLTEFQPGDIIVAAANFGCGSSREHAAACLKGIGVAAVVAESFGRIFYRNCVNVGLPVIVCPRISQQVQRGDTILVDLASGVIRNERTGMVVAFEALSEHVLRLMRLGGIQELVRAQLAEGTREPLG